MVDRDTAMEAVGNGQRCLARFATGGLVDAPAAKRILAELEPLGMPGIISPIAQSEQGKVLDALARRPPRPRTSCGE